MSIDIITKKIIEDAEKQKAELVDAANTEASKILSDCDNKIEDMVNKNKEKAQIEGNLQKERRIQGAILKVRNDKLAAKQDTISKTLDLALNKLSNLDGETFVEFVKNTIKTSGFTGEGEVLVNSNRKECINEELLKELNESLNINLVKVTVDDSIDEGFVIKQNEVYYNYTFKSIVESLRSELVLGVSKELF